MTKNKILEAIHSLTKTSNEDVDSRSINQLIPAITREDLSALANELENEGLIRKASSGLDFSARLTSKGLKYLID